MIDYENSTDDGLNKLMVKLLFNAKQFAVDVSGGVEYWIDDGQGGLKCGGTVDFCNNWGDMGPVIEKYDISLIRDAELNQDIPTAWWRASWTNIRCKPMPIYTVEHLYSKPLRAAVICFLKMKDAE